MPQPSVATGSIQVTSDIAGEILLNGSASGIRAIPHIGVTIPNVHTGNTYVEVREDNGTIFTAFSSIMVREGQTAFVTITRPVPSAQPAPRTASPGPQWNNPFISPTAGWDTWVDNRETSVTNFNIAKLIIDDRERDVLNMEVRFQGRGLRRGLFGIYNLALIQRLQQGSGVRFNALGDGNRWNIIFVLRDEPGRVYAYERIISTRSNKVMEFRIPYTRLQPRGSVPRFDKTRIFQMEIARDDSGSTATRTSTLKVFDFEVLP